jgi:hypothetical protein
LFDAAPPKPQLTTQLPLGQFVTVHPVAGHVMLQSKPLAQSTWQLVDWLHST